MTVFLFASTIMAPFFFPASSYLASVTFAFLAFALAFLARPLGGLVFGHFGDRRGRKGPWFLSLLGMGLATLLIGFLPTYQSVGILATGLIVGLRLLQGFFLAGEQSGGWTLTEEASPPGLRGLFGGIVNMGTGLAQVYLAAVILIAIALAPGGDFQVYGWRILFWLGVLPAVVAAVVRWRMRESSEWVAKAAPSVERLPIGTAVRRWPRFFVIVSLTSFGGALLAYSTIVYIPSFLRLYTSLSSSQIAEVTGTLSIGYLIGAPVGGYISDRLRSRKKYLILVYLVNGAVAFPLMAILQAGSLEWMLPATVLFGFVNSFFLSTIPAWVAENIPGRVRYSFIAVAGNIGPAFGVLAPFLIALLAPAFGPAVAASVIAATGGLVAAAFVGASPSDRMFEPLQ